MKKSSTFHYPKATRQPPIALVKSGQMLLWPTGEPIQHTPPNVCSQHTFISFKKKTLPTLCSPVIERKALERRRRDIARTTSSDEKSRLGQFFTPHATALFLASLFDTGDTHECRLLDPGAGIGSLCAAFLDNPNLCFDSLSITACEIDDRLQSELSRTLHAWNAEIIQADFIETAINWLQFEPRRKFTHIILNPPYKKIASVSIFRKQLRCMNIETVNLYSAFVSLGIKLLAPQGQLVAIVPRSFCNGPYYKPFRRLILKETAITHIHLFESRTSTFKDDRVLQENVVIKLVKEAEQSNVIISLSTDDTFADCRERSIPFSEVVNPSDPEQFIHIPTSDEQSTIEHLAGVTCSMDEIGITVSTGPIIDFRVKNCLRISPTPETVPLLYPVHCMMNQIVWPKPNIKKPNALFLNDLIRKRLFPLGYYCVVKRFSSKEEKRRITASVVSPDIFGDFSFLAFENHLNVFHEDKKGLPAPLAYGLSVYLNTSLVDHYFRRFNGHTQVNAMDLRQLRYPSRELLFQLGTWAMQQSDLSEELINRHVQKVLS